MSRATGELLIKQNSAVEGSARISFPLHGPIPIFKISTCYDLNEGFVDLSCYP